MLCFYFVYKYLQFYQNGTKKRTNTGEDLFISIDESLNNLVLEWKKLVSVTIDGGKNISGSNNGVSGRIKKKIL